MSERGKSFGAIGSKERIPETLAALSANGAYDFAEDIMKMTS